jgi:NDP-sugar pyrophosphorylase family protein
MANRPKVLAPIGGRPFLSYLFDQLENAGVSRVVLCTGHLAEQIEETFGPRYGRLALSYSREQQPLGTGGALRQALGMVVGDLLMVLNGDSYTACPLAAFLTWHRRHCFPGSLVLTWVEDASRFGTIEVGAGDAIASFHEKQGLPRPGWINAGIYLLSRKLIEALPVGKPVSLEREAFPDWMASGLGGYALRAPFLDIGTPDSLARAETFLAELHAAQ